MNNLPFFSESIPSRSTIIVGLSGGVDSVILLHLLHQLKDKKDLTIIAAHLDHEWRVESYKDAEWCKNYCKSLGIPFISEKLSNIIPIKKHNGSQEAYARNMRRIFFEKIKQDYNANFIALGHHKLDQVETFFIRLARGASLTGLTGMSINDGIYIRPLLHTSKQDIITYSKNHSLSFIEDPTNKSDLYLRNRIRHAIIPALQQTDERFINNIITSMNQLKQTENLLSEQAKQTIIDLTINNNPLHLSTTKFLQLHSAMQQRIILQLLIQANVLFTPSQGLFKEVVRFLQSRKNNCHQLTKECRLVQTKESFSVIKI